MGAQTSKYDDPEALQAGMATKENAHAQNKPECGDDFNGNVSLDIGDDTDDGDHPENGDVKSELLDFWRPFFERLLDRPIPREFPELNLEQESAMKDRGRNTHKKDIAERSTLPAHHDRANYVLQASITALIGELRQWRKEFNRLLEAHTAFYRGGEWVDVEAVRNFSTWWLDLDEKGQLLLQKADMERTRCFEFLGRPGVAVLFSTKNLWAPFPGCTPNRVRLDKRRAMHERHARHAQVRDLEREMEDDAGLIKIAALGLYTIQSALFATVLHVRPDFFAVESPVRIALTDMNMAVGDWGEREQSLFRLEIADMLGKGRGLGGDNDEARAVRMCPKGGYREAQPTVIDLR